MTSISDALGNEALTAPRLQTPTAAPSFRLLDGDAYELTTSSDIDAAGATAELALLGVHVPDGYVARLVEAKADPAAWHRDAQGEDAVTRPIVRRKFIVERHAAVDDDFDVAAAVQWIRDRPRHAPEPVTHTVGAFMVLQADPQIGKTGSSGGTQDTLAAITEKLDAAADLARQLRPQVIHYADLGDGCENTQNVAAQAHTNDLSFVDQLDLFGAITMGGCLAFADIAPTNFDAVPSNHMQLRSNREATGVPADDFGILNAKHLARAFRAAGRTDIKVNIPERHHNTMTLDIAGVPVGFAHGHDVGRPDRIPDWWQGQTFGDMPLAAARILNTGHFHTFRAQRVGKGRMWFQGDTLDAGSDWFASMTGSQSVRGLLTYTITDGRWDNVRVL